MLNILNNNIIEYVLNEYLDYNTDIMKLKQLYNYKFNIKNHIACDIIYYFDSNYKFSNNIYSKLIYLDKNIIRDRKYFDLKIKKLRSNIPLKNDEIHGTYKEWYENGIKKYECDYINNEVNGIHKKWYQNGVIEYEYNYINSELSGLAKEYDINGNLIRQTNY
jgi:antitoxin component YwqK of YwqJK toxin-antitoxin module